MSTHSLDMAATILFAIAILHTFLVKRFQHQAHRYPQGSIGENFFHLLGEIEIVFGLWSAVFIIFLTVLLGSHESVTFLEGLNFTEPVFVFVIMAMAATRPVKVFARLVIEGVSRIIVKLTRISGTQSFYLTALTLGPLLGSLITEPAAMTVTTLLLKDRFFAAHTSTRLKYVTLAVLLVNISIGGVLTNFAAPPVVIVANTWNWSTPYMFTQFGWKAVIAVILNVILATLFVRKELSRLDPGKVQPKHEMIATDRCPLWISVVHLLLIGLVVMTAHHMVVFLGIFLIFLAVSKVTSEYQEDLQLKESLLVAAFLGGLVILGSRQSWWLAPIIQSLSEAPMFVSATALTAVTDNAALTYLGSQVGELSETLKYSLMAGAVCGGGLTAIANAPNPIAIGLLKSYFGEDGISPLQLLIFALIPTLIAMSCFWLL